jgi:1-acyl-sn-glycerol-3-phosphate acyltransferase
MQATLDPDVPRVSTWLLALIAGYSRWYMRRHFHGVRLLRGSSPDIDPTAPLVVYLNHPSWWDPLVGLLLARAWFPQRILYAPIDARALRQYRFFARLGFFGVEQESLRGAADFLRRGRAVLRQPGASLWLTPQGRFGDVRERPVRFRPGLGHLARRLERGSFVPVGIEYVFWEERTPEVLVHVGQPVVLRAGSGDRMDADSWTARFEKRLEETLDDLGRAARRRQVSDWFPLLEGRAGVGLVYDGWRALRARVRGETFRRSHSAEH